MAECMLCGTKLGLTGICSACGLSNNLCKKTKDGYHFQFKDRVLTLPLKGDLSIQDYAKQESKEILGASNGYFKAKMCPFTMAQVGGTRAATLAFTGASINEYVWTHSPCMEEYCKLWSKKNNNCSFNVTNKNLE